MDMSRVLRDLVREALLSEKGAPGAGVSKQTAKVAGAIGNKLANMSSKLMGMDATGEAIGGVLMSLGESLQTYASTGEVQGTLAQLLQGKNL